MTDLSMLTGGPAHASPRPVVARGRVVKAPATLADPLTVTLENYSASYEYEVPATQWLSGDTLPVTGQVCLVSFDDDGDAWISGIGSVQSARVTANPPTGVAVTDGPHIQALIDQVYAAGAGKGIVYLHDGVYVGNVVLKPNVQLWIPPGGTLRGAAGVTSPVVDGLNFATLTGKAKATGDYLLGAPASGVIGGGTVDGNNVALRCVRLWGCALNLDMYAVQSAGHGIETEFTDVDSFGDVAQTLEGTFGVVRSHGHAGDGWFHKGPHDSVCQAYFCWDNTGWGFTVDAFNGAADFNGGMTFDYFNSFLNTLGSCRVLNDGFVDIKAGALSGDGGTGLDLSATSGSCRARCAVAGHAPGVLLRGSSHKIEITSATNNGYVSATGDVVEVNGAQKCEVNIGGGSANKCVLNFVSEVGPNYFHGVIDIGTGTVFRRGGTPNSQTTILFSANGAAGTFSEVRLPNGNLGFYGTTPTAKPTGVAVTAAGIHAALVTLGLIAP